VQASWTEIVTGLDSSPGTPKARAAATHAICALAVCGSKRSLSNDQNVEMPRAALCSNQVRDPAT